MYVYELLQETEERKVKAKSDPLLSTQVKLTVPKSSWPKKKLGQTTGRKKYKGWNPSSND